ncbi:MAG: hypothetical protein JXR13_16095 [Thalassovita sp.]
MPKPTGKGTLALISTLLIASATLRIAIGATQAVAKNDVAPLPIEVETLPQEQAVQSFENPSHNAAFFDELQKKEKRLKTREENLIVWEQTLTEAETLIQQRLTELEAAEARLSATISVAETASENDLAKLVAVYETMKPKGAAALFEEMDPNFAAGFLGRMAPESAAGILAGMKPETAYSVSVILAGRNANAPTN